MGHKVESFQSNDGVLFTSEEAMLVHEATVDLAEEFPQLKVQVPFIMANAARIAAILAPLHAFNTRPAAKLPTAVTYMPCSASGQPLPERPGAIVTSTRAADGSHFISDYQVLYKPESAAKPVAGGVCKAVQFSDYMLCTGCDLRWDTNDSLAPGCKREVFEEQRWPESREQGCDCAASMAGNGPPHHPTCPMFREPYKAPAYFADDGTM